MRRWRIESRRFVLVVEASDAFAARCDALLADRAHVVPCALREVHTVCRLTSPLVLVAVGAHGTQELAALEAAASHAGTVVAVAASENVSTDELRNLLTDALADAARADRR